MPPQSNLKDILIVDDDPILQAVLSEFVKPYGHGNVVNAVDGNIAVETLDDPERDIGLIFCDLNMPEKDGIEFLSHLQNRKCSIPIIIVTSASGPLVRSAS